MVDRDHIFPRWDAGLTEHAAALVETRRRRYVKDYVSFTMRGYSVAEELSPQSGHLITKGPEKRIRFVQELAAQDVISRLIEEDQILGRKREYDWTSGTVLPSRRWLAGEMITSSKHLRAFRKGVTIFVIGEQEELSLGSAVAIEERNNTASVDTLPVRRMPIPIGTRARTYA